MSQSYLDLPETNFPQMVDTFDRATDVTIDLLPLVKQYQNLYNNNRLNEASQLLIDNPQLQNCMINAKTINRCYDGIKALQRYYFSDIQKYIEELIVYKGEYNSSYSYQKYDVVIYNSSAYLCISNSNIGDLPTSDKFIQITLQGERGESGWGLAYIGMWQADKTYTQYDCVTYNNVLYASMINDNIGRTPSQNSSYWTVVFDVSKLSVYDNSSSNLSATTLQNAVDELNIKINNNTSNINSNSNKITSNTNSINDINNRISNVNNTPDSQKSVNYSNTSGTANYANSAGTASSCSGNSATATNANYANSAGNSDTVDGFHFKISTTDLVPNSSSLTTNTFYFVYE